MSILIEKLKKARQSNVEVEGRTFTITRPTPMQAMEWLVGLGGVALSQDELKLFFEQHFSLHNETWRNLATAAIEGFVIDWPGLQEIDLIPGGTGVPVAFDRELFLLWVQDYPAIVTGLGYHIFESWLNYLAAQDADEKKPETGLNPEALAEPPTA